MEIKFDSQKELFLYDMHGALENYNMSPSEFRKMSSSDWRSIKLIKQTTIERLRAYNEAKKMEAEAKAEMQRRMR